MNTIRTTLQKKQLGVILLSGIILTSCTHYNSNDIVANTVALPSMQDEASLEHKATYIVQNIEINCLDTIYDSTGWGLVVQATNNSSYVVTSMSSQYYDVIHDTYHPITVIDNEQIYSGGHASPIMVYFDSRVHFSSLQPQQVHISFLIDNEAHFVRYDYATNTCHAFY